MRRTVTLSLLVLVTLLVTSAVATRADASAPTVTKTAWWLTRGSGGGVAKTYIYLRATVRDNTSGWLTWRIRERITPTDWSRTRTLRRRAPGHYGRTKRSYTLRWAVGDQFWEGGWYTVRVTVRNASGKWSKPVTHQWKIRD